MKKISKKKGKGALPPPPLASDSETKGDAISPPTKQNPSQQKKHDQAKAAKIERSVTKHDENEVREEEEKNLFQSHPNADEAIIISSLSSEDENLSDKNFEYIDRVPKKKQERSGYVISGKNDRHNGEKSTINDAVEQQQKADTNGHSNKRTHTIPNNEFKLLSWYLNPFGTNGWGLPHRYLPFWSSTPPSTSSHLPSDATTLPGVEAAVYLANREFIKGFLSGQAILLILIFLMVKQFLLKSGPVSSSGSNFRQRYLSKLKEKSVNASYHNLSASQVALENYVLTKCGYDIYSHPRETCDWLSVLIGLAIAKYRAYPSFHQAIITTIDEALNNPNKKPSYLGPITLTDFRMGDDFPKILGVSLSNEYHLKAEIGFSYSDQICIELDTQVVVNWPRDTMASLPINLSVTLVKFAGTLCLEVISYPDSTDSFLSVSLLQPDFELEFQVKSLLGHRTKVKDLPKLTQLLCLRLRSAIADELVFPNSKRFKIPSEFSFLSSSRKTSSEERENGSSSPLNESVANNAELNSEIMSNLAQQDE